MHRSARYWLFGVLTRVIAAPFYSVHFADFWLADQVSALAIVSLPKVFVLISLILLFLSMFMHPQQFCSLTVVALDFEFTICHYWHCALYPEGMAYHVVDFSEKACHKRISVDILFLFMTEMTSALCSSPTSYVRFILYMLPGVSAHRYIIHKTTEYTHLMIYWISHSHSHSLFSGWFRLAQCLRRFYDTSMLFLLLVEYEHLNY